MVMPVKIWMAPRTSEPTMMAIVSLSGENSAGRSKVLAGLMSLHSCGIKSPKKPPVSAPKRNVAMPHQKIISMKLGSAGRFLRRNSSEPKIISRP